MRPLSEQTIPRSSVEEGLDAALRLAARVPA